MPPPLPARSSPSWRCWPNQRSRTDTHPKDLYPTVIRSSEPELEHTAKLGIAFLPWSPLGGIGRAAGLGTRHAAFKEIAGAHGVSPQQVTLAWMLAKAPNVIPIPGASRPESIIDSAKAAGLVLTDAEVARLGRS